MIKGIQKIAQANGLGYLMSPFSSFKNPQVAADLAAVAAAELSEVGVITISPVVHSMQLRKFMSKDKYFDTHEFWMGVDERMYRNCDYGLVCMLTGWETSHGVQIEIANLTKLGTPVYWYDPARHHIYTTAEIEERYSDELNGLLYSKKDSWPPYLQLSAKNCEILEEAFDVGFDELGDDEDDLI